jgi:predicted glycogen debranching enzyme
MISFGREICGDVETAMTREWLVTNGIGGFAAGTLGGILTRRYHGLLIAALHPPLGRTLLLSKIDEVAGYDGTQYPLATNQWANGVIDPSGFRYLERFYREGTIPVWVYAFADALLEKRVWMEQGANTTYIRYTLIRGSQPLRLTLKALVNYRDYHGETQAGNWQMAITPLDGVSGARGLRIVAFDGAVPLMLLSDSEHAEVEATHDWYRGYVQNVEIYRGFEGREDHLHAGTFHAALALGESLTIIASTEATVTLGGQMAYEARRQYEQSLLARMPTMETNEAVQDLILAADQFLVSRPTASEPQGQSVIAGYPWFGDWGRDTMISLPGLTLSTGRPEVSRRILRTFAQFIDQGMLPNRFPDAGETPEYNTVDATLWYFEAIRAYTQATDDETLRRELFPALREIVEWHFKGTRYQIHVDPTDGLLYSGEGGVQLTWMDAKVGDWVVTPRTGKAVEINALWYNALRFMAETATRLKQPATEYVQAADKVQANFGRFWNAEAGYCYDVIDTPDGSADTALRPNQLFAVSLPHSPLTPEQQKAVVDHCARQLLTSNGLRSLAPTHPAYIGHYGGTAVQRDGAYHQGTVWGWLIGPFVKAHLRVYRDPVQARQFLLPLLNLNAGCVGTLSEIFDGDPPFQPRGCFAQAWTVAEVLHAWQVTRQVRQNGQQP